MENKEWLERLGKVETCARQDFDRAASVQELNRFRARIFGKGGEIDALMAHLKDLENSEVRAAAGSALNKTVTTLKGLFVTSLEQILIADETSPIFGGAVSNPESELLVARKEAKRLGRRLGRLEAKRLRDLNQAMETERCLGWKEALDRAHSLSRSVHRLEEENAALLRKLVHQKRGKGLLGRLLGAIRSCLHVWSNLEGTVSRPKVHHARRG